MKRSDSPTPGRPRPGQRSWFFRTGWTCGLTCVLGVAACESSPPPPFALDVAVSPTPPIVGPARMMVMVERPGGGPLAGATVSVEGRTERGPVVRHQAAPEGPGLYTVDEFTFGRPGEWTVVVTAVRVTDGVVDTVTVQRTWTVSGR